MTALQGEAVGKAVASSRLSVYSWAVLFAAKNWYKSQPQHLTRKMPDPFLDDTVYDSPYHPAIIAVANATDTVRIGVPDGERSKSKLSKAIQRNCTVRELLPLLRVRHEQLIAWEATNPRLWPPGIRNNTKPAYEREIRESLITIERELGWGEVGAAEAAAEAAASS